MHVSLLATVFVLTLVAGACARANSAPTQAGLETATPFVIQTLRVSETLRVLSATPSATLLASTTASLAATTTPIQATATPNPTLVAGLIGLWQGDNGSFYLLNTDGTWNWDGQRAAVESTPAKQGRWWLAGYVFNIQDLSGTDPCPPDQIGAYQVRLDGDLVALTRLLDPCVARAARTAGQYTRQPAGP